MKDVAVAAGCAQSTVSNVINRPHLVLPETRERVEGVMRRLGYARNHSARHLRRGVGDWFGAVLPDVVSPFYAQLFLGWQRQLTTEQATTLLGNSDNSPATEASQLATAQGQPVRGLLFAPADQLPQALGGVAAREIHTVVLGPPDARRRWCTVGVDEVEAGRHAVAHLAQLGHDHVVTVVPAAPTQAERRRLRGVHEASHDHPGLELTKVVYDGRKALARVLDQLAARPTAVITTRLTHAQSLDSHLRARLGCTQLHRESPVVSFGDRPLRADDESMIRTVGPAPLAAGHVAARLMITHELRKPDDVGQHDHCHSNVTPELIMPWDVTSAATPVPLDPGGKAWCAAV